MALRHRTDGHRMCGVHCPVDVCTIDSLLMLSYARAPTMTAVIFCWFTELH